MVGQRFDVSWAVVFRKTLVRVAFGASNKTYPKKEGSMAINYKAVQRANPSKPAEPKKFFAQSAGQRRVDLKQIAQNISDKSTTVSHVDVYAVLMALTDEIRDRILAGDNVHLGDFATSTLRCKERALKNLKV